MKKFVSLIRWILILPLAIGTYWVASLLIEAGYKFSAFFLGNDPDSLYEHFFRATMSDAAAVGTAIYACFHLAPFRKNIGAQISATFFAIMMTYLAYFNS